MVVVVLELPDPVIVLVPPLLAVGLKAPEVLGVVVVVFVLVLVEVLVLFDPKVSVLSLA